MRPLFSSPDFTLLGGGNHPVGEAKREARDHSLHELEIRKAHARHGSRKMNDKNRILSLVRTMLHARGSQNCLSTYSLEINM